MDKYKIMSLVNLFFGVIQILFSVILPLFLIPGLKEMYSGMDIDTGLSFTSVYVITIFSIIVGITNLILGIKGFTSNNKKDKCFKYGTVLAVISFFLPIVFVVILNFSVIYPIYNLTSQI